MSVECRSAFPFTARGVQRAVMTWLMIVISQCEPRVSGIFFGYVGQQAIPT